MLYRKILLALSFAGFLLLVARPTVADDKQAYQAVPQPSASDWKASKLVTAEAQTDLSYGNGTFFLIGFEGLCLKSFDGKDWQRVNLGVKENLSTVCYGNGKWIVGARKVLLHSFTNGNSWDGIRTNNWTFGIIDVQKDSDRFLATSLQGQLMESTDGVKWRTIKSLGPEPLIGVSSHGSQIACLGIQGRIHHTSAKNQNQWLQHRCQKILNSICFGNGKFVAVGKEGTVLVKDEGGDEWQTIDVGISNNFYRVKFVDSTFYGLGQGGTLVTSRDGITWEKQDVGTTASLRDICFDGRSLHILASQSTLLSKVVHPEVTPHKAKDPGLATSQKSTGTIAAETDSAGTAIKKIYYGGKVIEPRPQEECVLPSKFKGHGVQYMDCYTFRVAEIFARNEFLLAYDSNGNSTYFFVRAAAPGIKQNDLVQIIGGVAAFNLHNHFILSREDLKFTPIIFDAIKQQKAAKFREKMEKEREQARKEQESREFWEDEDNTQMVGTIIGVIIVAPFLIYGMIKQYLDSRCPECKNRTFVKTRFDSRKEYFQCTQCGFERRVAKKSQDVDSHDSEALDSILDFGDSASDNSND